MIDFGKQMLSRTKIRTYITTEKSPLKYGSEVWVFKIGSSDDCKQHKWGFYELWWLLQD